MSARVAYDKDTGQRFVQTEGGEWIPAEEAGLLAQAGRQFASLGSGIKGAFGELTDQPELVAAAQRESEERNRVFQGADLADPIQSMVGQALPALATAPLSAGGLMGSLALNTGLGAVESAFDIDEGGGYGNRAFAGGVAGLAGDLGGRAIGRIWNTAKGLAGDLTQGRRAAANPKAAEFEAAGGTLLQSQRMTPNSPEALAMQRLEQGADASVFSPGLQNEAKEANRINYRDRLFEAVGLQPGQFDNVGPDAIGEAHRRLSDEFGNVAAQATAQGPIPISQDLADRIATTRGQIPDLIARGRFQGLQSGVLSGNEWNIARRALAQDAANRAGKGQYELADEIFADIEELDRVMEGLVGPGLLQDFARAREQYRVLRIASKQGVINADGDISVKSLNNALNQGTGFGTTARTGAPTVNPESKNLIDLARLGSSSEFQPFRSSGTAENTAAQRMAGALVNPLDWAQLAGEVAMPLAVGISSRGGGRAVSGLMTPAPAQAARAGGIAGRGVLDEALYPFVGVDDERLTQ